MVRGQLNALAVISSLNRRLGWAPEPIYIDPLQKRQTCLYRKPNYISLDVQPMIHDLSSILFTGYLRLKWAGHEVGHSHPSSIKVKNDCSPQLHLYDFLLEGIGTASGLPYSYILLLPSLWLPLLLRLPKVLLLLLLLLLCLLKLTLIFW